MVSVRVIRVVVMVNVNCMLLVMDLGGVVVMLFDVDLKEKIVFMMDVLVMSLRLCDRLSRLEMVLCCFGLILVIIVVLLVV